MASIAISRPRDRISDERLNDVFAYAASIGLNRFSLVPPGGAEYEADRSINKASYCKTAAQVISATDNKGRQRIKLPFRPLGHIVITEAEYTAGLLWFDILKAGYLFVHFVTTVDPRKRLLPALFARAVINRWGWHRIPSATVAEMAKSRRPSYQPVPGTVLMVIENLERGGTQRQLLAASSGLLGRGYDVKVFALSRLEPNIPNIEEEMVLLGIIPKFASETFELARASMLPPPGGPLPADSVALPRRIGLRVMAIAAAITRHRPAIVHCWVDIAGVAAGLAGCSVGAPRIVIQFGGMAIFERRDPNTKFLRQAYRAIWRNPSVRLLNNSRAGARDTEDWLGLQPGNVCVLYNGFTQNSVGTPDSEAVARFRTSLNIPAAALVVGTVMRFISAKDPYLWLDTAVLIARARPDVRFLICGYGVLERAIVKKIKELGLGECVVLSGPPTDVGLAYSAMDVVLLTSTVEGIPNIMIEAQAAGRPVVAPDIGGTSEAVLEGRTGVIARPRSAATLAKAVIAMLDEVDRRMRARTEGPGFVARRFGLDRMVEETLRHYGSDLGSDQT